MDEMKAGRDLDALIEEKVMGRKRTFKPYPVWPWPNNTLEIEWMWEDSAQGQEQETKPYSTSIEAAWEVVEKIKSIPVEGYGDLGSFTVQYLGGEWVAGFQVWDVGFFKNAVAETPAYAICLVALKAVEK